MHMLQTYTVSKICIFFFYWHLFSSASDDEKTVGACDSYEYDEDGDLIVRRTHTEDSKDHVITVGKNSVLLLREAHHHNIQNDFLNIFILR